MQRSLKNSVNTLAREKITSNSKHQNIKCNVYGHYAAIALSQDAAMHRQNRHLNEQYNFTRQQKNKENIVLKYSPTTEKNTEIKTKTIRRVILEHSTHQSEPIFEKMKRPHQQK